MNIPGTRIEAHEPGDEDEDVRYARAQRRHDWDTEPAKPIDLRNYILRYFVDNREVTQDEYFAHVPEAKAAWERRHRDA